MKHFQKKTIMQAILLGCITSASLHANPVIKNSNPSRTVRYLDPSIWNITVSEKDCFLAAPRSILEVEPVTSDKGVRTYKVSQIFDAAKVKETYAKSIQEQIKSHKIVGREFCNGIVSISNMDLPFTKGTSIQDANDGLLLVDKVRHDLAKIEYQLEQMQVLAGKAANGTYSSSQLADLDKQFQAHIHAIDTFVQEAKFNDVYLFNGSTSMIEVPTKGAMSAFVALPLVDLSTNSSSLNHMNIASTYSAQDSLNALYLSRTPIMDELNNLNVTQKKLMQAAKETSDTTMVNVTNDDFIVQHQTDSLALKSHQLHS